MVIPSGIVTSVKAVQVFEGECRCKAACSAAPQKIQYDVGRRFSCLPHGRAKHFVILLDGDCGLQKVPPPKPGAHLLNDHK
jgi:hypothetical protein